MTQRNQREIKLELLAIAEEVSGSSLLLKAGFQLRHEELYREALASFGTWEAVLAELVVVMRDKEAFLAWQEETPSPSQNEGSLAPRAASEEAQDPILALTTAGEVVLFEEGLQLPLSEEPMTLALPEGYGHFIRFVHWPKLTDLFSFTHRGLYYGLVHDFVPRYDGLEDAISLRERLGLDPGDGVFAFLSRREIEQSSLRLLHVTLQGKGKATELSEYKKVYGNESREAFLLKEPDEPVALCVGREFDGLFCASAQGQGIHMSCADIRSMGRKSVGVNVIKLQGADDGVVAAFHTDGVEELAVITTQGYAKRIPFREFRRQGRGGSGMQVARLSGQDTVAGVCPLQGTQDLVLTSSLGRLWRCPAELFPDMGRAARGKRIFEPLEGEQITSLSMLPCAGDLNSPPPTPEPDPQPLLPQSE